MSWLARLKNLQTPQGHATKPTEPGFVGFVAPPPGVLENSRVVEVPLRLRQVGPANVAAVTDRRHVVVDRACADCLHLLRRGTCGEPVAAGLLTAQQGFGIVWPPEGHGAACPAFTGKMPTAAADRPHKPTTGDAEGLHGPCRDEAELAAFTARAERFTLLGRADADDLADRLTLRDRDGDDRRLCLECTWLGDTGRCIAAARGRLAGADRRLEPVQTILQRCGDFGLRKGLV